MMYLDEEKIYSSKTQRYFKEVTSSFSIGNYRSAIVMLNSIVVCDLLYKLQELDDLYDDKTAKSIIEKIVKKSKTNWERQLIKEIHDKTDLINDKLYSDIDHLYKLRCFSAHPTLDNDYELYVPSQEETVSIIKNIYFELLIKPPIFVYNIVGKLTDDLLDRKTIFDNDQRNLRRFLYNKYLSRMSDVMKQKVFRALWKFCFISEDQQSSSIRVLLLDTLIYISELDINLVEKCVGHEVDYYSVSASNNKCKEMLMYFISACPKVYNYLNSDTQLLMTHFVKSNKTNELFSWFIFDSFEEYYYQLDAKLLYKVNFDYLTYITKCFDYFGASGKLLDFYIQAYELSQSFRGSIKLFFALIEPNVANFSDVQLEELIRVSSKNRKISYCEIITDNNIVIVDEINRRKLSIDFDDYPEFQYLEQGDCDYCFEME